PRRNPQAVPSLSSEVVDSYFESSKVVASQRQNCRNKNRIRDEYDGQHRRPDVNPNRYWRKPAVGRTVAISRRARQIEHGGHSPDDNDCNTYDGGVLSKHITVVITH